MTMETGAMLGPLMPATPTGLSAPSPVVPRKSNVPTRHGTVSKSAPGTKLAPRVMNVNPPPHVDRTVGKPLPQKGIATVRATRGS